MSSSLLIVEPHADSREMYSAYFQHHGATVHACEGIAGALAAPPVNAIVIAGRLPSEQDALTLIHKLRAKRQTRDVPILVLSATESVEQARRAKQAGCDDVVMIPCAPHDLFRMVRRAIARRRSKRTGVTRHRGETRSMAV